MCCGQRISQIKERMVSVWVGCVSETGRMPDVSCLHHKADMGSLLVGDVAELSIPIRPNQVLGAKYKYYPHNTKKEIGNPRQKSLPLQSPAQDSLCPFEHYPNVQRVLFVSNPSQQHIKGPASVIY